MNNSIKVLRRELGVETVLSDASSLKEGYKLVRADIKRNGFDAKRFLTYNKAYNRLVVDIGNPTVSYLLS